MNTEHTNQSRQAANAAFEQWWQRHGLEDPMDDEDRYYITASSWARRGYLAAMQEQQAEATLCASCARANVDCPIYPQQTASCVEHRPAAQQQAEPVAESVPDAAIGKLRVLLAACNRIEEEAEELEGADGLGMGIAMDYWQEFAEALTTARKALAASQQAAAPLPRALADIAAERRRQIEAEGWTPEHDDAYQEGHLADAAACYALCAHDTGAKRSIPAWWPWRNEWWKPTTARRDLVKAGALIAAEIERIDRAAQKGGEAC